MTDTGSDETYEGRAWTRQCREAAARRQDLQLTVHTRSAAPKYGVREYVTRVRGAVEDLEERGRVADVEYDVWGRTLDPADHHPGNEQEPLAAYRSWASQHDVDLPVEERHCNSTLIEDSYTVLVPPHVLVSVRDGDEILGVAPCSHESGSASVMDLLTILAGHSRDHDQRASASA